MTARHMKGCAALSCGDDARCDCGWALDLFDSDPFAQLTEDDMRAMRDAYEGKK